MDTTPSGLIELYTRMRADASGMVSLWDECGRMCLTRRVNALTAAVNRTANVSDTFTPYDAAILNTCAVDANNALAAGCAAWITPADQQWFVWEPVEGFKKDPVKAWLAECTAIARTYLAGSNFYTKVHELYLDRNTFGTGALMAEPGKKNVLNFRVFDAGSYVVADDDEGNSDLIFKEQSISARAAADKFGEENLPVDVTQDLEKHPTKLHRFLNAIYPRDIQQQERNAGGSKMPIASCWLHIPTKQKVFESGFEEQAIFINRYLRWSEFSPWGVSPAMQALAEIRGVQWYELLMSTLAEVTVSPRIILPQGFTGVPDLRAGGITFGGMTRDAYPQEWATGGRLQEGITMMERKEKTINNLFHKPLFDQFAQIEREITAAEVHAREAEKVARFSPAFHQLTTELINPCMERVFMILMRLNKFPAPPVEALYQDAAGNYRLAFPQTVQTSRMALAMAALKTTALSNSMALWMPFQEATMTPVFDNLDSDTAFRDQALGNGMPKDYLQKTDVVEQNRKARAASQQQQQQNEMAQAALKSNPLVQAGIDRAQQQQPPQAA